MPRLVGEQLAARPAIIEQLLHKSVGQFISFFLPLPLPKSSDEPIGLRGLESALNWPSHTNLHSRYLNSELQDSLNSPQLKNLCDWPRIELLNQVEALDAISIPFDRSLVDRLLASR